MFCQKFIQPVKKAERWQNLQTMKTLNMKAEVVLREAVDVYEKGVLRMYANFVEALIASRALTTMKAKKHMKAMKTMKAMKAMRLK